MKTARLAVLGVALTAGVGAAYMLMGSKPEPPAPVVAPAPAPTDAVLVASHDIGYGAVMASDDVRWQSWPKDSLPPGAIVRTQQPNGIDLVKGLSVRSAIPAGDLIRADRLRKGADSMSAVLPTGMRAVAIDLTEQGKSAAGGFIHPGDRVDVIRTFHPDGAPPATFASETILANIRVLAIGAMDQDKSGEHTMLGLTATLELTAPQAERVILAQRTGQLTLSLRSLADSAQNDAPAEQPQSMTIIRSGNASQAQTK